MNPFAALRQIFLMFRPCRVLILLLVAWLSLSLPVDAFKTFKGTGGSIHKNISYVLVNQHGFSRSAFWDIDDGNTREDYLESKEFLDPTHHFDNNMINATHGYVEKLKDRVVALAGQARTSKDAREEAMETFGALLHAVQDFYSHSNYLEIELKKRGQTSFAINSIPLIDWKAPPAGLKTGYFLYENKEINDEYSGITTIINRLERDFPQVRFREPSDYENLAPRVGNAWTSFVGLHAYKSYETAIENATQTQYAEIHRYLNKDYEGTIMGGVVHPSLHRNLHEIAVSLAERETERQWAEIEKRIRNDYKDVSPDRDDYVDHLADRIIRCLKNDETDSVPIKRPPKPDPAIEINDAFEREYQLLKSQFEHDAQAMVIPPDRVEDLLNRIREQVAPEAKAIASADGFLHNQAQQIVALTEELVKNRPACEEIARLQAKMEALLKQMALDEAEVEKRLKLATQLAKACVGKDALRQSALQYQAAEKLIQKIRQTEKEIRQMATLFLAGTPQTQELSDKYAELHKLLFEIQAQRATVEMAIHNLETLKFPVFLEEGRRGYNGNLSALVDRMKQELDAFESRYKGKVPDEKLFSRLDTLRMYIYALESQILTPEQLQERFVKPFLGEKDKIAILITRAKEVQRNLETLETLLTKMESRPDCLQQKPGPTPQEMLEEADTERTLAELAQTKLGEGYLRALKACAAQWGRKPDDITQTTDGPTPGDGNAPPPTTPPPPKPTKPTLAESNVRLKKNVLPAYLYRFKDYRFEPEVDRVILSKKQPDAQGRLKMFAADASGHGENWLVPVVQNLGMFSDIPSVCAQALAYGQKTVRYNRIESHEPGGDPSLRSIHGTSIDCSNYQGPIAKPKPFAPQAGGTPGPGTPSPGRTSGGGQPPGARPPSSGGGGGGAKSPLDQPDPWNHPQVQQLIDEWLHNAKPAVPGNASGRLHYDEWGTPVGPGITHFDHPKGISRHQWLWERRDKFPSLNLCTLGTFVEKRIKGQGTGDCQKSAASPPPPNFVRETGGIYGTPPAKPPIPTVIGSNTNTPVVTPHVPPTPPPNPPKTVQPAIPTPVKPLTAAPAKPVAPQPVKPVTPTPTVIPATSPVPEKKPIGAAIETSKGTIVFKFDEVHYPNTVKFFAHLIQRHYYDQGMTFHRVVPGFVVQTGDPGNGGVRESMLLETSSTPVRMSKGTVGMARGANPNEASSQFFITLASDSSHLAGQYAMFGRVVEGLPVLDSLQKGDKLYNIRLLYTDVTPKASAPVPNQRLKK